MTESREPHPILAPQVWTAPPPKTAHPAAIRVDWPTSAMVSFSKLCCVNLASSCTTRLDNTSCSDCDFLASVRVAGGWVGRKELHGVFLFLMKVRIFQKRYAPICAYSRNNLYTELSWLPRRLRAVPWRSATVPAKTPPPGTVIRGTACQQS